MAKFTRAELADLPKRNEKIVALYKKGLTGAVIAEEAGLTAAMVYMILKKAGASRNAAAGKLPAKKAGARSLSAKAVPAKKVSPGKKPAKAPVTKKIPAKKSAGRKKGK